MHGYVEVLGDGGHRVTSFRVVRGLLVGQDGELASQVQLPSVLVGGEVLGGGHQPRRRVVRDPVAGPLRHRDLERVLGEVLGGREVAGDAGERGDEAA